MQTRGAGVVWSWGAAKWLGQVAALVYGAAVGMVQGSRGRRCWQWQFCNFLEVQNPVM